MNFTLNDEQTLLQDSVRRFVERDYGPEVRRDRVQREGGFSRQTWTQFADVGWLGVGVPEADGGFGGAPADAAISSAIVLGELGRGLVVEPFLAIAVLAAQTLRFSGRSKQRDEMLAALISGECLIVLAHGEAAAAGRLAFVETRAEPRGTGFVLSGRKAVVPAGSLADVLIVSARNHGGVADEAGLSLFAIPANAPGVTLHPCRLIDGSTAADIVLDQVQVGAEAVLGSDGGAFAALDHAYAQATVAACAEGVGAMDQALWITRDYLRARKQFGVAIGSFQVLQHRLADVYIELEAARAHLYRALAYLEAADAPRRHAISAAKAQFGKSANFVGAQAIQLHGGIGVTEEYVIGHYFKRLKVLEAAFGNTGTHLQYLARALQQVA